MKRFESHLDTLPRFQLEIRLALTVSECQRRES
jgi:hypothetical protein